MRSGTATENGDIPVHSWWGEYELQEGRSGHWRLGPLELWIRRRPGEWRVAAQRLDDTLDPSCSVECPLADGELPGDAEITRFASRSASKGLRLDPVLPDRSVVTRPELPFHVLAGEEARFFVSTCVHVRLATEDGPELTEIPTVRMSDTWFSPSTRYGELCYASRTNARLDLASLPLRSHRAVTQVTIRNRADDTLLLERLNLPVPHLALFWNEGESLWTQALGVEREPDGQLAKVHLEEGAGEVASGAIEISPARLGARGGVLSRALGALLG